VVVRTRSQIGAELEQRRRCGVRSKRGVDVLAGACDVAVLEETKGRLELGRGLVHHGLA
jgi:hypothetical protein